MSADVVPPAGGKPFSAPLPEATAGQRRPPTETSSLNPKGDREAQHMKKKAKQTAPVNNTLLEDEGGSGKDTARKSPPSSPRPNVWSQGTGAARRLFGGEIRMDEWYTADSDSEDAATAMREDGLEEGFDGEMDSTCPPIYFTAAEERSVCRKLRSALIVKALGRSVSYTAVSIRLNAIWAKAGGIQVTSMKNGYFLVRFTSGLDYDRAVMNGPWMIGPNYLSVHLWDKDFDPYNHEVSSMLVWARLLDIPIQ
ncbi:unnamed protein product [Linum trigynum]|uniref:DUF4283 domain-containing protein n=1 Tax=Linum trigynum TaxID=586398 RepID=A0AAV2CEN5_9ROSI